MATPIDDAKFREITVRALATMDLPSIGHVMVRMGKLLHAVEVLRGYLTNEAWEQVKADYPEVAEMVALVEASPAEPVAERKLAEKHRSDRGGNDDLNR